MALGLSVALFTGTMGMAQNPTAEAPQGDPRAAIFVQRGCNACHGVWALGVKAKSDVAPDLTFAYVDVVNRYGMSLEAFLYNPSGVMRLMLASHLHLSVADRDSIAHLLEAIYKQHSAQLNQEIPPIAPVTAPPN
jgi:cytochrome c2